MTTRFRLTCCGIRGGIFYCVDKTPGKRTSLQTTNRDDAQQIVDAKNQAERQPVLNLHIAKAYLAGTDNGMNTRTWQHALDSLIASKLAANQQGWRIVAKNPELAPLLPRIIIETPGELLLKTMQAGTVSTNVFLRRLHNFCLDMNWLPWSLVPKRQWPEVKFKEKRAITLEEHQQIIAAEVNPERKAFYQLCWHLGSRQGDLPLCSQFRTASRLKVSSNFRRSRTDVCFMGLFLQSSPDSLSVNSRQPHFRIR